MLSAKVILDRLDKNYQVFETREQPSRSFLINFIGLLYVMHAQIAGGSPYSLKDITNTSRNLSIEYGSNLAIAAAPGEVGQNFGSSYPQYNTIAAQNVGIVVGTGNAVVSPTNYALQTKVAHGRAATQLEYGGCELVGIGFSDPNGQFTVRRYFTNLSGGGITINEIGIYAVGSYYPAPPWYSYSFCILRDLVSPGVTVANTELLRASYVIQITV